MNPEPTTASAIKPPLRLMVDPRIELVSLVFRLAGNPEYNMARVASYRDEVKQHFDQFKDHPCVRLARELRRSQGVSYDACMGLAVILTNAFQPALKVRLEPWPDFLDRRWTVESATRFVALLGEFVRDTSFQQFAEQHAELFRLTDERLQELLDKEAHLEWFQSFFGERPRATFTVIPALLNGGSCYGPHCGDATGEEELFCILGVWQTDKRGLPSFDRSMLSTVIHEFCHSYANAIMDQHASELESSGQKLYAGVARQMRGQAYGNAQTMLRESLVRACVVRYVHQYDGPVAARMAIAKEITRGFSWTAELSELLGQYESQRDRYPTLQAFSPRLVKFFNDYAAKHNPDSK